MNSLYCVLSEWLPIIKDFVLTGAAVVAGYIGLKGLGTWRQQFKGNKEYELAKQLLKSIYELREAIYSVRNPFMQFSEEPDLPEEKLKALSDREKRWHALAQAYQRRWEPVPKAKTALDTNLLEAEVVWGKEIVRLADPLHEFVGKLLWAVQDHIEAMNPNNMQRASAEEIKERRGIMYDRGSGDDEYKKQLEATISALENELRPHIEQFHR